LPISHTSGLCVWVLELVNSLFVHMHKTDRVSQENIAMRISLLSIQPSSPVASAWGSRTPAPPRRRRWTSCAVAHNDSSWCVLTKQDVTESGFAQMRRRQTKRRGRTSTAPPPAQEKRDTARAPGCRLLAPRSGVQASSHP
jgi:hypothetical protein